PYLMELIWSQVVLDRARSDPKFAKLKRRQKLTVVLELTEIVEALQTGFTFRSLDVHVADGAPATPHRNWVTRAMEQFVALGEAEWLDATKESVRVFFQKYDDALAHFVGQCARAPGVSVTQLPLEFPEP